MELVSQTSWEFSELFLRVCGSAVWNAVHTEAKPNMEEESGPVQANQQTSTVSGPQSREEALLVAWVFTFLGSLPGALPADGRSPCDLRLSHCPGLSAETSPSVCSQSWESQSSSVVVCSICVRILTAAA